MYSFIRFYTYKSDFRISDDLTTQLCILKKRCTDRTWNYCPHWLSGQKHTGILEKNCVLTFNIIYVLYGYHLRDDTWCIVNELIELFTDNRCLSIICWVRSSYGIIDRRDRYRLLRNKSYLITTPISPIMVLD